MSYVNQVPNLPFRYDVPTTPLIQYRLDSPPFVPNLPGIIPQVQYLLPMICATLANELAAKCQAHPGRTFLYNQLSFNNFANNDFAFAVNFAIDLLTLNLRKNLCRTPEEGINTVINDTLSLLASVVFQNFPALTSVAPQDVVYQAGRNIQAYNSLVNEIMAMKSQMQTQPMMMNQPMVNQPMMVNPNFGMNPVAQPMMQSSFGNGINNAMNSGNLNTPIFSNNRSVNSGNVQPVVQNLNNDKYDYLKPKTPPPVIVPEMVRVSTPLNVEVEKKTNLRVTDWVPSLSQAYPPTINPYRTTIVIGETVRNGVANKILKTRMLEDSEMDRSKHVISSISQVYTSHIPLAYGTREESLEDNVKKIFEIDYEKMQAFKNDADCVEPASQELLSYINPAWIMEGFIESALFNCKLKHRKHNLEDPTCSIYRTYNIVANPIICADDHKEFIAELAACKSFKELVFILRETINDSTTSKSLIDLCYGVDKILTKEINHVLRNKMSIPKTTIESFIDDVNDLPDYLGNTLGSMYKQVFLDFQRTYVSQIVSGPCSEKEHLDECCLFDDDENSLIKVNVINHSYSITCLSVEDHELGIEPFSECASSILEFEHPLMYKIVTGIFNQDREIDHSCLHNLIVTADDVVYEVQKGLIGTDIITINHWKK